jgi:hypothetical protein
MNRDVLRLISTYLRGDDLVTFTEISWDCYWAVGHPAPVPDWDVYRALRDLDTLSLRRNKVDLWQRCYRLDADFAIVMRLYPEYERFATCALSETAGLIVDFRRGRPINISCCTDMDRVAAYNMECILAGREDLCDDRTDGKCCYLRHLYWRELIYREDPALITRVVESKLCRGIYEDICASGPLWSILAVDDPGAYSASILCENPHEDSVRYMISKMPPVSCISDQYPFTPLRIAKLIVEIHGNSQEVVDKGLVASMGDLDVDTAEYWIGQGAKSFVAAACFAASDNDAFTWLVGRPEVQEAADYLFMYLLGAGNYRGFDLLAPFLRSPEIISSVACAINNKDALRWVPCGCQAHRSV